MLIDDRSLLDQYTRHHSQEAFSAIVNRYLGLVCSSARRHVGDAHLAEDISQAVFLTLARKAAELPANVALSSWLLTTTRHVSQNLRVVRDRRRRHESVAAARSEVSPAGGETPVAGGEESWENIEPELGEALAALGPSSREALILRYFEGKSMLEVAGALEISEDAAKQRVSRAVRQLRETLTARGAPVTMALLAAALPWQSARAAPSKLADTILAAARDAPRLTASSGGGGVAGRSWLWGAAAAVVALGIAGLVGLTAGHTPRASASPNDLVYRVPGMDQVEAERDRTYRQVGDSSLWFDLYRPRGEAPPAGWPLVVLIHGGPIPLTTHPKDWLVNQSYGRVLAASGLAAVTFNFRYVSSSALADAASDVAALIDHVRSSAKELRIDPDRIGLWAFSGGGPMLGAAIGDPPAWARCLVSFYALLDARPGQEQYSPLARLREARSALLPMFVARMGKENAGIQRTVDAFLAEAKRRGDAVEVREYPEGIHAFDSRQDTGEARQVIAAAVAFVKRHLDGDRPPPADTGMLELDGGSVFHEARGNGPALVLLHDGLLHRETWDAQWRTLPERWRVVRYDRRGHGKSPAPAGPFSDVEDLAALLRHHRIDRATLVGCSSGGKIAIDFALAHPGRVERLVLVGAIVSGMSFSEHFRRRNQAAFQPLAEKGDLAGTIARWQSDPYLIRAGNDDARRRLGELLAANPQNLAGGRGRFELAPEVPALRRLGEIRAPALIVVGEADIPDVHAQAGAIEAGIAGSRRVVVEGAGHLVHMERAEELGRLLQGFVSGER